jgi:hypothetical protein
MIIITGYISLEFKPKIELNVDLIAITCAAKYITDVTT